jgi:hypothetical protein
LGLLGKVMILLEGELNPDIPWDTIKENGKIAQNVQENVEFSLSLYDNIDYLVNRTYDKY